MANVPNNDFYEDDEPVAEVLAAFEAGPTLYTSPPRLTPLVRQVEITASFTTTQTRTIRPATLRVRQYASSGDVALAR